MGTLFSWLDQTINKNPVAALTVLVAIFIFLFGYLLVRLQEQIRSLGDYVDGRESAQNQKYKSLRDLSTSLLDKYIELSSRIEDPAFKGDLAIARELVTLVNKFMENCNTHFCRLDNHVKSLEESLGNRLDEVESALETLEDALKYGTASDTDAVKDELLDCIQAKGETAPAVSAQEINQYQYGAPIQCDPCLVTLDGQFLGGATVKVSQPRGRGLVEPPRLEITTRSLDANVSALKAETSQLAPEAQTSKWVPQIGDWVRITKPESWISTAWMQDMDKYDGEVVLVTEIDGRAIVHDDWAFCFEWLGDAPAMPTTPESAGYFDDVEGVWIEEKSPFDGRRNSDKIPQGYRKLKDSSIEPRQLGDLRWSVSQKRYVEIGEEEIVYANRDNWAACRTTTPEVTGEVKPGWMPTGGERVRFKGQPEARPDWIVDHLLEYPYVHLKRSTDGVPSGGYVSQLEPAPKPEQETEAPKPRFSRGELVRIVCPKGLLAGETYKDPISNSSFYAGYYEAYLGKDGQIVGPSTTKNGLWEVMVYIHGHRETIRLPEAMLHKVLS